MAEFLGTKQFCLDGETGVIQTTLKNVTKCSKMSKLGNVIVMCGITMNSGLK